MTEQEQYKNENLTKEQLIEWANNDADFVKYITARNKRFTKDYGYDLDSSKVEGYDYLLCPISGLKYVKYKKSYADKLMISEKRLFELFPEYPRVAPEMIERSEAKQNTVDPTTGMSIRQSSHKKAMDTLNSIDPATGKRGYDLLGAKTRDSHLSNIDEYGMNGYHRIAESAVVKGNKTKASNGEQKDSSLFTFEERYRRLVDYYLYKLKPDYYTRGYKIQRFSEGGYDAWQIDHMYSEYDAIENGVSIFMLNHIDNTRIITARENMDKGDSSVITIGELYSITGYTKIQNDVEYEVIKHLIDSDIKNETTTVGSAFTKNFIKLMRDNGFTNCYSISHLRWLYS